MPPFGSSKVSKKKAPTCRPTRPSQGVQDAPGFIPSSAAFPRAADADDSGKQMIDLLFAMDCTASMGSYIEEGKRSIAGIVDEVKKAENTDIRFGYCAYRDHPPQDHTFVTMCHDFTPDTKEMKGAIATFGPQGGGDGPEAVTAALNEALHYPWRKSAVKIVVLIADAPPHGISPNDGFPEGDPNGLDPVKIAHEMASQGIILYVVACEPSLSNYKNAHDVMEGLAMITEGRYLPLTAASLLPAVIVGGACEELALQKLEALVDAEASRLEKANMSQGEIETHLTKLMEKEKVQTKQVEITDIYGGYDCSNIKQVAASGGLREAMAAMAPLAQPQMQMQAQSVSMECKAAPVSKMMARRKKKK